MKKQILEVIDKVDYLNSLLDNIDIATFEFFSENYGEFHKTLGTYQVMECRFNTNSAKMQVIRDMIIEIIKEMKTIKRNINNIYNRL